MDILLRPILESISSLRKDGISVQQSSGAPLAVLRPMVVMGVFDLPAKATATNTKQFNGKHGCLYCMDEGQVIGNTRIYHPTDRHVLKTTTQMKAWALMAEQTNIAMKFWFNSEHHSKPFSLRKHISEINKMASEIKPPNEVQRLPRSINHMSFFKATEYRAWILFYALPLRSNFLHPE